MTTLPSPKPHRIWPPGTPSANRPLPRNLPLPRRPSHPIPHRPQMSFPSIQIPLPLIPPSSDQAIHTIAACIQIPLPLIPPTSQGSPRLAALSSPSPRTLSSYLISGSDMSWDTDDRQGAF